LYVATHHSIFCFVPSPLSVRPRTLALVGFSCMFLRLLVHPSRVVVAYFTHGSRGDTLTYTAVRSFPIPQHDQAPIVVWTTLSSTLLQSGCDRSLPLTVILLAFASIRHRTGRHVGGSCTARVGAVEAGRTRHKPCAPHSLTLHHASLSLTS
jgi:hypothetical protein